MVKKQMSPMGLPDVIKKAKNKGAGKKKGRQMRGNWSKAESPSSNPSLVFRESQVIIGRPKKKKYYWEEGGPG